MKFKVRINSCSFSSPAISKGDTLFLVATVQLVFAGPNGSGKTPPIDEIKPAGLAPVLGACRFDTYSLNATFV